MEDKKVEPVKEAVKEERFVYVEIPASTRTVVKDNSTGEVMEVHDFILKMANKLNTDIVRL